MSFSSTSYKEINDSEVENRARNMGMIYESEQKVYYPDEEENK